MQPVMRRTLRNRRPLTLFLAGAMAFATAPPLGAQQQPLPEDYIRPAPITATGQAPKMKGEPLSIARTFKVTFSQGDDLLSGLTELAVMNHIASAQITGLGGFITATLGWADLAKGAFKQTAIDEKCEVVSLLGNISLRDGKPYVHIHVVVSFPDGSTKGGHLVGAHISPIAEIFVVESESATAPKSTP
jgi:predicted DNA-binding protein with PD1-like motif